MIKNYFKIAWRNLWKNKTYSFINILGLTLGLVCFLLIALYVFDELTYDSFHKNASNIYRVVETKVSPEGKESKVAAVAYKISEQAPVSVPEVKKTGRYRILGRANVLDPVSRNTFYELFTVANPDFLNVFDFKLLEGNRASALTAPRSVLLTEDMAKKIFGVSSVVGRTLQTDRDSLPYTITGIMQNFPSNSHISFNLIFSETSLTGQGYRDFIASDWNSNAFPTYLLLDKKADIEKATQKLNQLVTGNRANNSQGKTELSLQPLKSIHFYSAGIEGDGRRGNISYIYVFSIVALFVLLIACINYMNLTTARFASRGKEIAVRKVAGAGRRNLITQFLAEAFVMAIIALILALSATWLLLPSFNAFAEKRLSLNAATDYRVWLGIFITILVVGLFAGAYPALFQSRLKPYLLLKNKIQQSKGQLSMRKGLVVFQFALSIIMIVATLVIFLQMKYVNTTDLGFNKEQLLVVDINSGTVRSGAETIKTEYATVAAVKSVSVTSCVPGEWKTIPKVRVRQQGSGAEGDDMYYIAVDDQFLKTYEMSLLKGRNFSDNPADSSAVLINETAASMMGIKEPSEQMIEIPSIDFNGRVSSLDQPFRARIVGITKDFNFRSLREKIAPMIMAYKDGTPHTIDYFTVRLNTDKAEQTLKQLESILHKIDAGHLFEYHFLDKQWDAFYREDQKRQTIFLAIAIMTILIACLGLFGLATYAAEQRIKEIGIRKVLGASVTQLIAMLSKEFVKLVIIAAIIAIPVAWWMMENWLNDFAYRTKIYWWVFVIAGSMALFIALFTVGLKALKAAIANPVKSLRTE
ncbi:MAG TPA: ABC transporter permease [Chitinophagaceae bacterium]|nr:ABC transporter permease [Chitinophagaceae bacterium]